MTTKEFFIPASPPYRERTKVAPLEIFFVLNSGGIGDYIHWIGAIKCAIDTNIHIHGEILCPPYFYDLAELWLGKYSERFKVDTYTKIKGNRRLEEKNCIIPNNKQYANACGFHLTELGFIYFTQKNKIDFRYAVLPEITGKEADISRFNLPKNYAVIPTEATAENRMLPANVVNAITAHLLANGVTPVFLGKTKMSNDYKAKSADGIKTKDVIDLRDDTSLREAACIMAGAKFVLGLDGGLLHLASCSRVPVVFIFTTVHPDYRVPYRQNGVKTLVITPPKELPCRFCNTGTPGGPYMGYVVGHDFKECLYKDNLCTKIITADTLLPVIDNLLKEIENGNEVTGSPTVSG